MPGHSPRRHGRCRHHEAIRIIFQIHVAVGVEFRGVGGILQVETVGFFVCVGDAVMVAVHRWDAAIDLAHSARKSFTFVVRVRQSLALESQRREFADQAKVNRIAMQRAAGTGGNLDIRLLGAVSSDGDRRVHGWLVDESRQGVALLIGAMEMTTGLLNGNAVLSDIRLLIVYDVMFTAIALYLIEFILVI